MIKIVTIIGARPQIIKAAALSRAIRKHFSDSITEIVVHTGQHYDDNMSQVFFDELNIPQPDYNLKVGSLSHGKQTAKMIEGIEDILVLERPDYIVLYGDTNSTLAGVIAASKIHVPIVHIEAGLRSFNKNMPEEINRICCDHCSTMLFSPTATGYNNLVREGFNPNNKKRFTIDNPGIYHCGDVMYDNSKYFSIIAENKSEIMKRENLIGNSFILCTIHRDSNTDNKMRLESIITALLELSEHETIVIPLHPRTEKSLKINLNNELYDKFYSCDNIRIIPPASFLDMINLEKSATMIMTDSGGVQKEAYFFNKPCIIMRSETEWKEIVETGSAVIVDADKDKITRAYQEYNENPPKHFPSIFGDGYAAEFICNEMIINSLS